MIFLKSHLENKFLEPTLKKLTMKNLYTLVLCFFIFSLQAQEYYYNGSEKIEIYKSDKYFISFETPNQDVAKGFEKIETFSAKGFTILANKKANFSTIEFDRQNLNQITPALLLRNGSDFKMFPTKTIRVKLKPNIVKTQIERFFVKGQILKIEERYDVLCLEIKDIHKLLEIANRIYESGLVEFSIPDFYIPIELNQVNDPLFPLQFQMHNTGQVIDGIAGVNDIDVNALEAWDINLGDNVTVAVFDQGLENHEDFGNRLIGGFTPATNGNGTPLVNNETHGMNCAGVIGASDDNLGLRGVAPNVNFLSVNIFADGTTVSDLVAGIQWAIDNGADVLSNSWSFTSVPCGFTNIDIEDAIHDAVTTGRNKKGAVVVFSAGNTGACVKYPARNNNVISVGAVDNRGNLFSYSSRGAELDLVAPSGKTKYLGNIRTTDRMDDAGRVAGNYEPSFGGTSASCPVVSGVAALVLSINPDLTHQEVRDILTATATDMGAGGFDNNFGFGRVNAFAAVQEAQQTLFPKITVELEPIGTNYVAVHMVGANGTNINDQEITSTTWQKISSSGGCYASFGGSGFEALGHGSCNSWRVYAKITATNSYGTSTIYRTITPPAPYPCVDSFIIASNPTKVGSSLSIIIEDCSGRYINAESEKEDYTISIYNKYGERVYIKTQKDMTFTIDNNLKEGLYIVKFKTRKGNIITKKLIVN